MAWLPPSEHKKEIQRHRHGRRPVKKENIRSAHSYLTGRTLQLFSASAEDERRGVGHRSRNRPFRGEPKKRAHLPTSRIWLEDPYFSQTIARRVVSQPIGGVIRRGQRSWARRIALTHRSLGRGISSVGYQGTVSLVPPRKATSTKRRCPFEGRIAVADRRGRRKRHCRRRGSRSRRSKTTQLIKLLVSSSGGVKQGGFFARLHRTRPRKKGCRV